MAPDQTSRVMGDIFDIREENSEAFQYFSKRFSFPRLEILDRFEIALQRMEIYDCFKVFQFLRFPFPMIIKQWMNNCRGLHTFLDYKKM
jgi:hypothetical protein